MEMKKLKKFFKTNSKLILALLIPALSSLLPIIFRNKPSYCAFIMLVMIFYWLTECIPVAMTSILPVLLFPLFGIMSSRQTSQIYFQDILMLFYGVIVLANSFKKSGLHEKISLKIIALFGSDPKWILLAVMLITAFLSLWLPNNESAAIMILPVTILIVKEFIRIDESIPLTSLIQLDKAQKSQFLIENNCNCKQARLINPKTKLLENEEIVNEPSETNLCSNQSSKNLLEESSESLNLIKSFCLGVGYAAIIGGSGSLIGGTTNILLKGYFDEKYPNDGLNFFSFIIFSLPVSLLMLAFTWLTLIFLWFPKRYWFKLRKNEKLDNSLSIKRLIESNYENMDSLNWEQVSIATFFIVLVTLWLTRDLYFVNGWNFFFEEKFVSDTTPVILILLIMSIWPKRNLFKGEPYEHLIDWKNVQEFFPWHIILFAGGSLALAKGFQQSNLSHWIGSILQKVMPGQKELALLFIILLSEIGTEFICNCSIASILLPIVDSLAKKNLINHFYLLLPTILSINLSFMLPMATPTNAIIFASGFVKTKDMILTGGIIKIIGFFVIMLASNTWLFLVFDTNNVILSLNQKNSSLMSNYTSM